MKKLIAFLFIAGIMALASCAPHRTCPTYLKNNHAPVQQESRV